MLAEDELGMNLTSRILHLILHKPDQLYRNPQDNIKLGLWHLLADEEVFKRTGKYPEELRDIRKRAEREKRKAEEILDYAAGGD